MIVESDNDAAFLLYGAADERAVRAAYADLGLRFPETDDASDTTTVAEFARFFRFLYNSTYLTEEYSEYALGLLAEARFNGGIVDGTPGSLTIAHKFGERTLSGAVLGAPIRELHDCGIVYHPERPYLLCIMTKGHTFDDLANIIRGIATGVAQGVVQLTTDGVEP